MAKSVLIVDDEVNILRTLQTSLRLEGFLCKTAISGKECLKLLEQEEFDAVFLDVKLPDLNGIEVLKKIKGMGIGSVVIMMSGHSGLETAIQAIKLGAYDFLEKPISTEKLIVTLNNALKFTNIAKKFDEYQKKEKEKYKIVGSGALMQKILHQIKTVAPTNSNVLIRGESGTGKELVARAIHEFSKRKNKPFVKVNCAAIPSDLLESELFGHEKGAFTGAYSRKKGKFELAHTGTIFLDEVGDLSQDAQAKVLRAIQEGEIQRVGGSQEIFVDVRIIAATNKNLEEEIKKGNFREDLFYRLNVIPFFLPPLREHKEDIPELVQYFLKLVAEENDLPLKTVTKGALKKLMEYSYPGNIRELKNIVERIFIMSEDSVIDEDDVKRFLPVFDQGKGVMFYKKGASLKEMVQNFEREVILLTLKDYDYNVTKAAVALNIERTHLYKKMKALNIDIARNH